MPTSKEEKNNDFSLFHRRNKDAFEAQVISAKKLAEIKDAIEKKSLVAALEQEKKLHQEAYNDWLTREREKIQTALDDAADLGKSEVEIIQLKRDLEKDLSIEKSRKQDELAEKQRTLDERITQQREKDEEKIYRIASRWAQTEYNSSSIYQRKKIQQQLKDQATSHKQEAELQRKANTEALRSLAAKRRHVVAGSEEAIALDKQKDILEKEQAKLKAQIKSDEEAASAARAEELKLTHIILDAQTSYVKDVMKNPLHLGAGDLLTDVEKAVADAQAELEKLNMEIAVNTELKADQSIIDALNEQKAAIEESVRGFTETAESLYAVAESEKASKASKEAKEKYDKTAARSTSDMANAILDEQRQKNLEHKQDTEAQWKALASPEGLMNKMNEAMTAALNKAVDVALDQIDQNIASFYEYQAHVEARLQGSDTSYKQALKEVSNNIGISGVVSQKDVIKNIKELSDKGIAYNLELRAFLGTVADSIANTFDAFDASLLRIIRLQQADTTAARLGMEASLTKLFNEYFSDTSYLSDVFDSVSATILDASSQLARDQSVAFEYMVQKWLGSLYSLGFSQETLQTIAQGITYLGTGNVQELSGNESLNNLMAMAATRIGLDYGAILVDGLDSDTTNKLLKSIVEYLQSIANNTDNNQVVKAAYTDVFGLNMTDLRAIQSLSEGDVQNIYNKSLEYDQMIKETNKQMLLTITRVPFAQMIDTAFENAMAGASTTIGNNPALYATWKVLNVVEDLTGGIDIPAISVMGSGVDLNTTVVKLAKLGVGGLGLMGSLLSSLLSGGLFGTFSVDQWDWDEYTSRGGSAKGITKGSVSDVSESQEMSMNGSSSSEDVKQSSMSDAEESAQEDSKITNKNTKQYADIYEKIYSALADDETTVLKEAIKTNELLEKNRIFKTSMEGMSALLDPKHIFYTQTVVYGPDGQPVFGSAGATLGGGNNGSTSGTDTGGTTGGATSPGGTTPSVTDLITETNELLTAANALYTTGNNTTSSIKSSIESLSTKIDSILTSEGNVVTQLTAIKDLLVADRLFKTDAGNVTPPDLNTVDSALTNLQNSSATIISLLKATAELLNGGTPVQPVVDSTTVDTTAIQDIIADIQTNGLAITELVTTTNSLLASANALQTAQQSDVSSLKEGIESLSSTIDSIISSEANVVTQLTSIKDLLVADRAFKTDNTNTDANLDIINAALATIQSDGTSITNLITTTNDLLKLDRVFKTSSDIDLNVVTQALDIATKSVLASLGAPSESSGEETKPVLQSLFELFTASTIEGNVAAILEKLSSDKSYTITATIPPLTTEQLTTLIGSTVTFRVDTSLLDQNNINSTLQNVQNSIEETNNSTQDVVDAADALTNSVVSNSQQSSSTTVENLTTQPPVTSADTTIQQTDVSNSMVDNITSLVKSVEEWEMLVAQAEAAQVVANEASKVVLPESMTASLTTISPDVKKQLEAVLKEAFVSALLGSTTSATEEETSLTSILQSVLSSLSVRVTNDFFDETLQKIAFTN